MDKRTVLYDSHCALGARMTRFGGFEMPVSYSGIIEEHLATRTAAGLFDLSHMGEFELSGPHAIELLERALTNSAAQLKDGEAQYSLMCAEDGGTIDDLIVYRLAEKRYMLCVNASNIGADREWIVALNGGAASFEDKSEETALVAIQGPKAAAILGPLTSFALAQLGRFRIVSENVAGIGCWIARTGYTGEDGFELFAAAQSAPRLFEAIREAGAKDGLRPCGLGARDTLRLEAGYPLYGHELDRQTTALEAGLSRFVRFGRGFVGEDAIAAEREAGVRKKLIGLCTADARSVARQGYGLFRDGREIGTVTSGTFAPSIARPIAMGYARADGGQWPRTGETIEVEIRGRKTPAIVTEIPFYRRGARHEACATATI